MSKENVLRFLSEAANDNQLKAKLSSVSTQAEMTDLGRQSGYSFSDEHIDEVLTTLKEKPGFFEVLAEAVFKLFSPQQDHYPATGVQPFSGDQNLDQ